MPKVMEAEARITAIDATGTKFEDIAKKVKGLSSAFRSLQGITSSGVGHINKTIGTLQKTMHTLAPVAAGVAGAGGLRGIGGVIHETVKATAEQAHEAVRMNVSGMSETEIAEAEKLSLEMSQRYRSLSQTTVMHSLRNMRAIVGTYEEAAKILDPVLKLRVAAQGAHPEHAEELGEDFDKLVKGMEIKGVTMDPDKFRSYMQGMAKAINVFGDTLRPTDYYEMFKYGRQATQNLSEQFMLETAPTLAQELGGSSAGKALSSFYQAVVGGRVKEQSVKEMEKYGLINQDRVVKTKTGSIKGLLPGGVKGWELAGADPYAWTNQVLLPALEKKGITSQEEIQGVIATIFQQGTAAQMVGIFATQQERIGKDWRAVRGARGLESAAILQSDDPFVAWMGVTEQFKNLLAIAGGPLAKPAAAGMNAIASGIVALENAAGNHPIAAPVALVGGTALGGGVAAWLSYMGLKGVGNWFRGGAAAGGAVEDLSAEAALKAMQTQFAGGAEALAGGRALGLLGPVGTAVGLGAFGVQHQDYGVTPSQIRQPGESYNDWTLRRQMHRDERLGASLEATPGGAQVNGSADLNVSVKVEPSDSFISRIVQSIRNEINLFNNTSRTAGSTGLSMPEAAPGP